MREYLAQYDRSALASFTELEIVDEAKLSDIRLARKAGGFAFEFWCSGGDLKDVERLLEHFHSIVSDDRWLEFDEEMIMTKHRVASNICVNADAVNKRLSRGNVWAMSLREREKLLLFWKKKIEPRTILDRTAEVHRRHNAAVQRKRTVFSNIDARSLANRKPPSVCRLIQRLMCFKRTSSP